MDEKSGDWIVHLNDLNRNPVRKYVYHPQVVAIGPRHRPNRELHMMERFKKAYLKSVLSRRNESNADRYMAAMRELAEKTRKSSPLPHSLHEEKFVGMMVLDACFIVGLFHRSKMDPTCGDVDSIFRPGNARLLQAIKLDLILFENQLPFCVLHKFFNMTKTPSLALGKSATARDDFRDLAISFLGDTLQGLGGSGSESTDGILVEEVDNLLGLVHRCWCSSFARSQLGLGADKWVINWSWLWNSHCSNSAVKFKKAAAASSSSVSRCSLFHVMFKNDAIEIPPLTIDETSDTIFANHIRYESFFVKADSRYVTKYIHFMKFVLKSEKDVRELRRLGILESKLEDDGAVLTLLSKWKTLIQTLQS